MLRIRCTSLICTMVSRIHTLLETVMEVMHLLLQEELLELEPMPVQLLFLLLLSIHNLERKQDPRKAQSCTKCKVIIATLLCLFHPSLFHFHSYVCMNVYCLSIWTKVEIVSVRLYEALISYPIFSLGHEIIAPLCP